MYTLRTYVAAGGVLAYGVNSDELARAAAVRVDEILRGADPT